MRKQEIFWYNLSDDLPDEDKLISFLSFGKYYEGFRDGTIFYAITDTEVVQSQFTYRASEFGIDNIDPNTLINFYRNEILLYPKLYSKIHSKIKQFSFSDITEWTYKYQSKEIEIEIEEVKGLLGKRINKITGLKPGSDCVEIFTICNCKYKIIIPEYYKSSFSYYATSRLDDYFIRNNCYYLDNLKTPGNIYEISVTQDFFNKNENRIEFTIFIQPLSKINLIFK